MLLQLHIKFIQHMCKMFPCAYLFGFHCMSICDPMSKSAVFIRDDSLVLEQSWDVFLHVVDKFGLYATATKHDKGRTLLYSLYCSFTLSPKDLFASFNSLRPSDANMRHQPISSLLQIMACRLAGDKPLSEPILEYCQLNPWEEISVKSEAKFTHFL